MKKVVVFDFDGTLVYTLEAITYHVNLTLNRLGIKSLNCAEISKLVGHSSRYLLENAIKNHSDLKFSDEEFEKILEGYKKDSLEKQSNLEKPYSGIEDLLNKLVDEGYRIAILSNKPEQNIKPILDKIYPNINFECIFGFREGYKLKPHPDSIKRITDELNVSLDDIIYVGDSEPDAEFSKTAGLPVIICLWGYRTREQLEGLGQVATVETPEELYHELKKIN